MNVRLRKLGTGVYVADWTAPDGSKMNYRLGTGRDGALAFVAVLRLSGDAKKAIRMLAGSKGGKARAAGLTPAKRKAAAEKAVNTRWANRPKVESADPEQPRDENYERAAARARLNEFEDFDGKDVT